MIVAPIPNLWSRSERIIETRFIRRKRAELQAPGGQQPLKARSAEKGA